MPCLKKSSSSYSLDSTITKTSQIYPVEIISITHTNILNGTINRSKSIIDWPSSTTLANQNQNQIPAPIPPTIVNQKIKLQKPKWYRYVGILFTLLANMSMSLMALMAKLLTEHHPFTLSVWRYCGNIFPTLPIILYLHFWKNKPILKEVSTFWGEKNKEHRTSVVGIGIRGLIGACTTITRFAAQTYISFGDTSVITQSTPAVVFIFAFFCLGEKCSIVALLSAALAISGLFVLSRPPLLTGQSDFNNDTLIGIGLATTTLLCSATSIILTRRLRKINFAVLIFGYGIGGLLVSASLAFGFGVFTLPTTRDEILLILALGFLTFAGQMFTILALKYEEAGTVSIISLSYVIFAFIWQIIFIQRIPDLLSIIGSTIVMSGILLTALRKYVQGLADGDSMKEHLSCLMR